MGVGAVYTTDQTEIVARNDDLELTDTNEATVLEFTPNVTGTYEIGAAGYCSASPSANFFFSITYNDPNAGAANPVTLDLYNTVAVSTGPFSARGTIRAEGGQAVTLKATAGTADVFIFSTTVRRI